MTTDDREHEIRRLMDDAMDVLTEAGLVVVLIAADSDSSIHIGATPMPKLVTVALMKEATAWVDSEPGPIAGPGYLNDGEAS